MSTDIVRFFILTALQLFTASALAQSLCLSFRLSGWWIIKTQRLVTSFACSSHTPRSGQNFDHGEPCPILPFMSDDIICQGDRDVFCLTRGQSIGLALDAQAGIISIIAVALAFVLIFVSSDFRYLAGIALTVSPHRSKYIAARSWFSVLWTYSL